MKPPVPLIVTGADGRIGRLTRLFAQRFESDGFSPLFLSRGGVGRWDMTGAALPDLPVCGFLLHLAGVLPRRPQGGDLVDNVTMAQAVLAADRTARFAHVFAVSTVAVYAPQGSAIAEEVPPDPQNAYGRAKLAAEEVLRGGLAERLTVLRLGNLAGADALLGGQGTGLDPVAGGNAGPLRSYIGPAMLVEVLARLMGQRLAGQVLPGVINLALPGVVAMGDLLDAAGREWHFGPERPETVARVEVDVTRLSQLAPLPRAEAGDIVADLQSLRGRWP